MIFFSQGFKVAYVVYKEPTGLKKAMKMDWPVQTFSTEEHPIKIGLDSMELFRIILFHFFKNLFFLTEWTHSYKEQFVDPKALQAEIDRYMKEFDAKKQKEEEELRAKEGEPDEEGWITVTKQ